MKKSLRRPVNILTLIIYFKSFAIAIVFLGLILVSSFLYQKFYKPYSRAQFVNQILKENPPEQLFDQELFSEVKKRFEEKTAPKESLQEDLSNPF